MHNEKEKIFCMKEVCPLFLLEVQRPLSSMFITGVHYINKYYYVFIRANDVQNQGFIKRLEGTVEVISGKDNQGNKATYYEYTPPKAS